MHYLTHKKQSRLRRSAGVKAAILGTNDRPRLAVHISNQHVTAQIIDDSRGKSLAYSSSVGQKLPGTMTKKAAWVGDDIAKKAGKAKIKQVVFDRSHRKYHGRVKALADAARATGLEF